MGKKTKSAKSTQKKKARQDAKIKTAKLSQEEVISLKKMISELTDQLQQQTPIDYSQILRKYFKNSSQKINMEQFKNSEEIIRRKRKKLGMSKFLIRWLVNYFTELGKDLKQIKQIQESKRIFNHQKKVHNIFKRKDLQPNQKLHQIFFNQNEEKFTGENRKMVIELIFVQSRLMKRMSRGYMNQDNYAHYLKIFLKFGVMVLQYQRKQKSIQHQNIMRNIESDDYDIKSIPQGSDDAFYKELNNFENKSQKSKKDSEQSKSQINQQLSYNNYDNSQYKMIFSTVEEPKQDYPNYNEEGQRQFEGQM